MAHWLWRGGALAVDADRALEVGNGQKWAEGFDAMVGNGGESLAVIRKQAIGRTAPRSRAKSLGVGGLEKGPRGRL